MAGKIIVAGHICLDITPVFASGKTQPLASVLTPGKLVQMKDVNISTGGAVANTGLALKVLGADAELMGKVGDDEFGQIVLDRLRKYGAEGGMLVSADSSTSYSVVIAPPGTDRISTTRGPTTPSGQRTWILKKLHRPISSTSAIPPSCGTCTRTRGRSWRGSSAG